MTDHDRSVLRQIIDAAWEDVKADYAAAGAHFGPNRGIEIWIEYHQGTAVN